MRYSGLIKNDVVNGEGICVSLFTQGCPHRCTNCFNQDSWDFDGGLEAPSDLKGQIIKAICANGIQRNFSILGGEPLCQQNLHFVDDLLKAVKVAYPDIIVHLWTGYTLEQLTDRCHKEEILKDILSNVDVLIDGPYIEEEKDLTLKWRGSKNQRIIHIKEIDFL